MKIVRMTTGDWGKVKAFFDVEVESFTIKGFKLVDGANGLFVGNPSTKNKDGEYKDSVFIEKPTKERLTGLAIECYKDGGIKTESTPKPIEVDDIQF